jgi:hypothetical protein
MTQADGAYEILPKNGPLHRDTLTSRMLAGAFRSISQAKLHLNQWVER